MPKGMPIAWATSQRSQPLASRLVARNDVREAKPQAIEQDTGSKHSVRGQHRASGRSALAVALPEPVTRHQPHAFVRRLAPHVEQLGAWTEALLAILPDPREVLGIGIAHGVAPCHTREIATGSPSGARVA